MNADHIEAVIQILPEFFLGNCLLQIPVRRGDNPDVRPNGSITSNAGKLPFLKNTEKFALNGQRHLTNLVEEKSASIPLLEATDTLGGGTSERTFLVTEELALQKILGNSCAVDRNKGLLASLAVIVDRACDQLLSTTALSGNQYRGIAHRDATHHFKDRLHCLGLTDNIVVVLLDRERRFRRRSGAKFRRRLQRGVDNNLHGEGERLLTKEIKGPKFH